MSQHTPRIVVHEYDDSESFQLQDDYSPRPNRSKADLGCPVLGYATWEDGIPRAEALANARLWAAAPDLLEVCEAALAPLINSADILDVIATSLLILPDGTAEMRKWEHACREAHSNVMRVIAKARGGT